MRTTIDKAGRVVIPKAFRERAGIVAGEVEIEIDGSAIRIEPVRGDGLVRDRGRLVIPASGTPIDDELVRALRDAGRR